MIIPWWKLAGIALIVAFCYWQLTAAYNRGVASEREKARIEAGKRIVEMEKRDEGFRKLSAVDRCRLFMRDSGLPDTHCD